MNIYRVRIGYDIAVRARDVTDAENKARWELREGNLNEEQPRVKVISEIGLDGSLPEGWDENCAPYGDNRDGHSIRWLRNEMRPEQVATFRIVGSANVIEQARKAFAAFEGQWSEEKP